MTTIFDRVKLTPDRLRTAADRRFEDAQYLLGSGKNKHANGVYYLGGFVLACRLKAAALGRYPWLQNLSPSEQASLSRDDQRLYDLCYRRHDLEGLLAYLSNLKQHLWEVDPSGRLYRSLQAGCSQWTIFARYSPQQAKIAQARVFLDQIRELKKWLQ